MKKAVTVKETENGNQKDPKAKTQRETQYHEPPQTQGKNKELEWYTKKQRQTPEGMPPLTQPLRLGDDTNIE